MNYNIVKNLLTLPSEEGSKFKKELNLIEWGNKPAKLDLRGWDESHNNMTKGLTLTDEEANYLAEHLKEVLNKEE